ncbi:MAG: carboxypeptidase-like regulatory domain-containing protein, partial [Bacteroidales bacterium]|nr:carboxypeptidase-like regulatory domain-containing protein [Bacteroidales bacterium]
MRKPLIITLYLLFSILPLMADGEEEETGPRYTISGHIRDAGTGENLIGAAVMVEELNRGTVTNVYGFYSLSLSPGFYHLKISYIGYEMQELAVNLNENQTYNLELKEEIQELAEVTIRSEGRQAHVRKPEMGVNKLPIKSIKRIPTLMG